MRREDGRIDPARVGVGPAGTVLTSDGMVARWQTPSAGGGGSCAGYGEFEMSYGTLTSNSSNIHSSSIFTTATVGDHGVSNIVSSGFELDDADYGAIYVATFYLILTPSTNAVASDLHTITFRNTYDQVCVGTDEHQFAFTEVFRSPGDMIFQPRLRARCSGGTDREYDIDYAGLELVRWDHPV